ncbi:hypothetical protein [Parasitella parasitica]|uniref:Uncharacterized protein n=1 Tax=Parasitella parasitica TaxID=35722 RepID=A0A0B7NCZ4_9FUNG|nr:hypothetical protein [Parasitella parasitica]
MQTYINKTAATTTTTSQHHQPHFTCSSSGTQLMDAVTMSFLDMDEWVAQELQRIVKNQLPRNCYSYEALITIIEGINQEGYYTVMYSPCSPLHKTFSCITQSNTKVAEVDTTLKLPQDAQKTSTDPQEVCEKKLIPSNKECRTNDTLTRLAAIGTHHLTRKNLIMAFMKLVFYYYSQHKPMNFYLQRHRKPLELLIQLENMCDTYSSWKSLAGNTTVDNAPVVDTSTIIQIQQRLHCILFGDQIPLVDTLVCPWTLISLYVQQGNMLEGDPQQSSSGRKWIEFGVSSYQIAKKACGIGELTR